MSMKMVTFSLSGVSRLLSSLRAEQEAEYPKATPTVVNLPCVKSEKPAWVWAQWMTQTIT